MDPQDRDGDVTRGRRGGAPVVGVVGAEPLCGAPTAPVMYFFSGKIARTSIDLRQRILVVDDETHEDLFDNLTHEKVGNVQRETICESQIVRMSDFMDLDRRVYHAPIVKDGYELVGPAVLSTRRDGWVFCHSVIDIPDMGLSDSDRAQLGQVINQRNRWAIERCDVFSLELKGPSPDCFQSMSEWGMALANNKMCIMYFGGFVPKVQKKEFWTFMRQSLDSFEGVAQADRDAAIRAHPVLPMRTFSQYKQYIHDLMDHKNIRKIWVSSGHLRAYDIDDADWRMRERIRALFVECFQEWRRLAIESYYHPERKRQRGEFTT